MCVGEISLPLGCGVHVIGSPVHTLLRWLVLSLTHTHTLSLSLDCLLSPLPFLCASIVSLPIDHSHSICLYIDSVSVNSSRIAETSPPSNTLTMTPSLSPPKTRVKNHKRNRKAHTVTSPQDVATADQKSHDDTIDKEEDEKERERHLDEKIEANGVNELSPPPPSPSPSLPPTPSPSPSPLLEGKTHLLVLSHGVFGTGEDFHTFTRLVCLSVDVCVCVICVCDLCV